jgi:hypothetical protein
VLREVVLPDFPVDSNQLLHLAKINNLRSLTFRAFNYYGKGEREEERGKRGREREGREREGEREGEKGREGKQEAWREGEREGGSKRKRERESKSERDSFCHYFPNIKFSKGNRDLAALKLFTNLQSLDMENVGDRLHYATCLTSLRSLTFDIIALIFILFIFIFDYAYM